MKFPTITKDKPLILASKSPRRRRLLEQLRLPFRIEVSGIQEENRFTSPSELVRALAIDKATHVYKSAGESWILGADTIVEIGGLILGKPEDHAQARKMLNLLSGKTHRVLTGFSLVAPGGAVAHAEVVCTEVKIKELSPKEIEAYIQTGEPFGKAGSYAIQGIGAFMVEYIYGSYTNVVGLPLCALVKALLSSGALECFPTVSLDT